MKTVAWILLLLTYVLAQTNNEAQVSFGSQAIGVDKYGRAIYEVNITATTKDFISPTLLARPMQQNDKISYKKDYNISLISTHASIKIHIDGDSPTYEEDDLDPHGGSGQRPFLLPNSIKNLQEGERVTLWFEPADGTLAYDPNDEKRFYPLDVDRDEEFTTQGSPESCRGFFGFFACWFDHFFERTIGIEFFGQRTYDTIDYPLKRQKYMANIFYGIDHPHLLQKDDSLNTQTPAINTPISLLDYKEIPGSGCKAGFFNFGSNSLTCKFIKTFSFDQWMPFVETTDTQLEYKRITEDTRLTLLALMGYKERKTKTSFFSHFFHEIFKPMRYFVSLFFPNNPPTHSNAIDNNITVDKPLLVVLPIANSDGTSIEQIETYRLWSLHQAAVKEITGCQRRFEWGFVTGQWKNRDMQECKQFIDEAIDSNNSSLLKKTIHALSNFFSFFFPKYKYRGQTTSYTKLGITIEKYTPSITEGNPEVELDSIIQTGNVQ